MFSKPELDLSSSFSHIIFVMYIVFNLMVVFLNGLVILQTGDFMSELHVRNK